MEVVYLLPEYLLLPIHNNIKSDNAAYTETVAHLMIVGWYYEEAVGLFRQEYPHKEVKNVLDVIVKDCTFFDNQQQELTLKKTKREDMLGLCTSARISGGELQIIFNKKRRSLPLISLIELCYDHFQTHPHGDESGRISQHVRLFPDSDGIEFFQIPNKDIIQLVKDAVERLDSSQTSTIEFMNAEFWENQYELHKENINNNSTNKERARYSNITKCWRNSKFVLEYVSNK